MNRIEVKSSGVLFQKSSFRMNFQNIKMSNFDDLILVGYFPDELYIWKWDKNSGLSRSEGRLSFLGNSIIAYAPVGQPWTALKSCMLGEIIDRVPIECIRSWEQRSASEELFLHSSSPFK